MDIIVVAILDLEYVWNEVRKLREERVQLIFLFELIRNEVMRKEIVLQFIEPRHPFFYDAVELNLDHFFPSKL